MENKVKEWSVGSYCVALKNEINWYGTKKGDIYSIICENRAVNITKNSHTLVFHTPKKIFHGLLHYKKQKYFLVHY